LLPVTSICRCSKGRDHRGRVSARIAAGRREGRAASKRYLAMLQSVMASTFWRSGAQYFASGIGLALVTSVCVRFEQDIHVTAFGYLILIVALA
jgi:hypothetical protein